MERRTVFAEARPLLGSARPIELALDFRGTLTIRARFRGAIDMRRSLSSPALHAAPFDARRPLCLAVMSRA